MSGLGGPPRSKAVLGIAVLSVSVLLGSALKTRQIGRLQSRLALLDAEVADYKRKLNGATPNEAKARIDLLEQQLEKLGPRRLTQEQRRVITHHVSGLRDQVLIRSDRGAPDTLQFSRDLAGAFHAAGWTVRSGQVGAEVRRAPEGLALRARPSRHDALRIVAAALSAAGLHFCDDPAVSKADLEILITGIDH
jgi:hypothetical protein